MRHFITGLFGTGKTTYAKALAAESGAEYIGFDQLWDDAPINPEKCHKVFAKLPEDCVTDAIPYDPTWRTFSKWGRGKVRVTTVCCSEGEWERRNAARKQQHPCGHERWLEFWLERMPCLGMPCDFYDTEANAPVSRAQAMEKVGFGKILLERLEVSPKGYDWRYQAIDEVGFVGYAPCADTWGRIRSLADWRNATVVDLGCNHAYMLWRAEEAGASKLIGLDESVTVLGTARMIRFMRGAEAQLSVWGAGEPIPEADITLCLNVLHHFKDPVAALAHVKSPVLLVEAPERGDDGQDLVAAMRANCKSLEVFPSCRVNRSIYKCVR